MTGQLPLFGDLPSRPKDIELGDLTIEPIPLDVGNRNAGLRALLPEKAIVEFTKHYPLNGVLLTRLIKGFADAEKQNIEIARETLSSSLTIPWANAEALLTFAKKNYLINRNNRITIFSAIILEKDPYFLNPDLLWFLHYLTASNATIVVWSRTFDELVFGKDEYYRGDPNSLNAFDDLRGMWSENTLTKKVPDEVRTVMQSYTDGAFRPLGLVLKKEANRYAIITDQFSIPPYIWLASILAYRDRYYPGATTLETRLLVEAHFSPGRLFRQREAWVRQALDEMHRLGLLTVETRLGLDQVRFKSGYTWLSAVAQHLQEGR